MKTPKGRRAGYSLLEMLIVVAVLSIAINLCGSLFVSASRMSAVSTQALDRLGGVEELRREFTEAVRASAGVVEACGPYTTGAQTVVLRMPPVDGHARFRVLGTLGEADRFSRFDLEMVNGAVEPVLMVTYRQRVDGVAFSTGSGAITLELKAKRDLKEKTGPTHTFVATPRGILDGRAAPAAEDTQ